MAPEQVAVSVYLADGRVLRLGPDEPDPADVLTGLTFETNNPGGFGSATLTLARPANLVADDAKLFSHVEVYGPGGQTYYEGLVVGVPQVGADQIQLQVSGWVSVLDRIQTFRQIYVDRDLSRWGGMSTSRRVLLHAFTWNIGDDPALETDASTSDEPRLVLRLQGPWAAAAAVEAEYDAGPLRIAQVYYDYLSSAPNASQPSATFNFSLTSATENYTMTGGNTTGDLHTVLNGTASGYFDAGNVRFCTVQWSYSGANAATIEYDATVGPLAVYGDHGLDLYGDDPKGVLGSDVVRHLITRAPSLTTSPDSIEATSLVIPHLAFTEDTSLRSAVEQITALGGAQNVANDWGVYEGREFYWRSPGSYGRTWHVRKSDVAESSSDGPDADRRVAGIKVNYTNPAGEDRSVGPPGSGADYETTELLDVDPDNPAHRIPGAYTSESVGITTQAGAVNIGVMILNERNRLDWRGSVTITGEATDASGNTFSPALVRAGDQIVIDDAADPTARTITATSYDHDNLSVTCDIGAPPDSLEALLGQLALVTDLVNT